MTNDPTSGSRPRSSTTCSGGSRSTTCRSSSARGLGINSIEERKRTAAAEAAEKLGTTVEEVVAAGRPRPPAPDGRGPRRGRRRTRRTRRSATRAARRCSRPAAATSARAAARRAAARRRGECRAAGLRRPSGVRVGSRVMAHRLTGIHHIQLAMPPGEEQAGRTFYGELLGLPEVPKPSELAPRGGIWFRSGALEVHLGVEREDFRPANKAHPRSWSTGWMSCASGSRAPGTGSTRTSSSRGSAVPRARSVRQPARARRAGMTELPFRRLDPGGRAPGAGTSR